MRTISLELEEFLNQISPVEIKSNPKLTRKIRKLRSLIHSDGFNLHGPGGGGGGVGINKRVLG